MKNRNGFTLIELMVVILIVGILAAIAIPILRSRIDAAKWSEGKSMMGTIATAMRAYAAEKGTGSTPPTAIVGPSVPTTLGFDQQDLTGTYFQYSDFGFTIQNWPSDTDGVLRFTITCNPGLTTAPSVPAGMQYVEDGVAGNDPFVPL